MSTLAEIEQAIEKLPPTDVEDLYAWLAQRRSSTRTNDDDLLALAGSWEEDAGFDAAVKAFEQVDEALWK